MSPGEVRLLRAVAIAQADPNCPDPLALAARTIDMGPRVKAEQRAALVGQTEREEAA